MDKFHVRIAHCGVTHFLKSLFTLNLPFKKRSSLNLFLKIWIQYFYIELVFTKNRFSIIDMSFHCGVTHFWKYEFSLFTLNLSFLKNSLLNLFLKIWIRYFYIELLFTKKMGLVWLTCVDPQFCPPSTCLIRYLFDTL